MTPQYIAGLFDGEGCLTIHKRRNIKYKYVQIAMRVVMTSEPVIYGLYKQFGGSFHKNKRPTKGGRTAYTWAVGGLSVRPVLEFIQPWVIVKRKQVELGLKYCNYLLSKNSKHGVRISQEDQSFRDGFAVKCGELNA